MTMIKETIDDLKSSIKKAEESLRRELAKVRTGARTRTSSTACASSTTAPRRR